MLEFCLASDRLSSAIRQLCHVTQQVRAAFEYATSNVFQTSSRQPIQSHSSINSNNLAQIQAMQQALPPHPPSPKSPSIYRSNGSIRSTP